MSDGDLGLSSCFRHSPLDMDPYDTSPLYKRALDSFKTATANLDESLGSLEALVAKSSTSVRETLNSKLLLQTKLTQAESRLKSALNDLSIQRNLKEEASSLSEMVTALQQEVRWNSHSFSRQDTSSTHLNLF